MYEAHLQLEAVTPIFMRGADQAKAEIRAASIKGLMRWWFRALAGSYFGNDIVGLRKAEEYVFGSTEQRSRVVVEVEAPEPCKFEIKGTIEERLNRRKNEYSLRPKIEILMKDCNGGQKEPNFPIPNYLFFSIKMFVEDIAKTTLDEVLNKFGIRNRFKDRERIKRVFRSRGLNYPNDLNKLFFGKLCENAPSYHSPKSKFKLRVKGYDQTSFKLSIATLWLMSNFGGMGFRSRRGAGSVIVSKVDKVKPTNLQNEVENLFRYDWRNLDDASKFWHDCAKKLYETFRSQTTDEKSAKSPYSTIANMIILEYGDSYCNCFEALRKVEEIYAGELKRSESCSGKFRPRYENGIRFVFADRDDPNCEDFSHVVVKDLGDLEKTSERRFYFGLPMIYANWNSRIEGYNPTNPNTSYSRRTSAILMTVKKRGERFVPLVIILLGQFLPDHDGRFILIKDNSKKIIQIIDNGKPFDNDCFVSWLKNEVVREFKKRGFNVVYPKKGVFM